MVNGDLSRERITVVVRTYETNGGPLAPSTDGVTVRYEHWDGETKEWDVDPYRAGLAK